MNSPTFLHNDVSLSDELLYCDEKLDKSLLNSQSDKMSVNNMAYGNFATFWYIEYV